MYNLNNGLIDYLFSDGAVSWVFHLTFILMAVAVIAISYLLGSINSAIIISRVMYHDDVRTHGSGNAGMTNMLRTYGKNAALLTLLGDLLKTAVAIFIAGVLFGFNYYQGLSMGLGFTYVAALFAVIGHVFPIYYKFRGGKGVLSTATALLILSPFVFLILFALFAAIVGASKYVSLGSVSAVVLLPVLIRGQFAIYGAPMSILTSLSLVIIAVLIVWCHRGNLQRISNRTENKLSFGKKKTEDVSGDAE